MGIGAKKKETRNIKEGDRLQKGGEKKEKRKDREIFNISSP